MQAIVYSAARTLTLQDVPPPDEAAGEVIVKVAAVGICGSEIGAMRETTAYRTPPLVMGHEFSGTRCDNGERVTVNPVLSCGACRYCRTARPHLCESRAIIGVNRPGAFAEYVRVPAESLIALPAAASWRQAALAEPMATATHVLAKLGDLKPERVGIIGAGGIGILLLLAVLDRGWRLVSVADASPARLDAARDHGAVEVDPALTGEFDVIFDTVGTGGTRAASIAQLGRGGHAVWIGLHDDAYATADARALIRKDLTIHCCFAYTSADFVSAVDVLSRVDVSRIVETVPLSAGVDAFDRLLAGTVASPKVQLIPS